MLGRNNDEIELEQMINFRNARQPLMKTMSVSLMLAALLASSNFAASQSNSELTAQVWAAEIAFARTMEARDYKSFQSHIADDAIFLGDEGALRGLDAVAAGWRRFFEGDTAPFSWEPNNVEVLESGKLAHSSGPVRDAVGNQIATYNSIWRLDESGRWKVIFDKGCTAKDDMEKEDEN